MAFLIKNNLISQRSEQYNQQQKKIRVNDEHFPSPIQ